MCNLPDAGKDGSNSTSREGKLERTQDSARFVAKVAGCYWKRPNATLSAWVSQSDNVLCSPDGELPLQQSPKCVPSMECPTLFFTLTLVTSDQQRRRLLVLGACAADLNFTREQVPPGHGRGASIVSSVLCLAFLPPPPSFVGFCLATRLGSSTSGENRRN